MQNSFEWRIRRSIKAPNNEFYIKYSIAPIFPIIQFITYPIQLAHFKMQLFSNMNAKTAVRITIQKLKTNAFSTVFKNSLYN